MPPSRMVMFSAVWVRRGALAIVYPLVGCFCFLPYGLIIPGVGRMFHFLFFALVLGGHDKTIIPGITGMFHTKGPGLG